MSNGEDRAELNNPLVKIHTKQQIPKLQMWPPATASYVMWVRISNLAKSFSQPRPPKMNGKGIKGVLNK